MRKTKKTLSLLLALCMVLSLAPLSALGVRTYYEQDLDDDGSGYPLYDTTIEAEDGPLIAYGTSFLIMSDIHDTQYENNRLKQLLTVADPDREFGAILQGGDYESGMVYETDRNTVQEFNEIVDDYYGNNNMIVLHTMGNHERDDSDAAFESYVGWPRVGPVVTGYDEGSDPESDTPIYFVYALGWYGYFSQGTMHSTGGFNDGELAAFRTWMSGMASEYGTDFSNIPVFVVSHTPIHYYTDSRSTANSEAALNTFNNYSNVILTWGHNHTEKDPLYTSILEAGDVLTYGRNRPTSNPADPIKYAETLFSYTGMGSGRANGWLGEMAYRVDLSPNETTDGTTVNLTYYRFDDDTKTVMKLESDDYVGMDSDTTIEVYNESEKVISIANIFVDRPRYGDAQNNSAEVTSKRFIVDSTVWDATADTFAADTGYEVTVTISPKEDYSFDTDLIVYINGVDVSSTIEDTDGSVTVSHTFDNTVEDSGAYSLADALSEANSYALVGGAFDSLANDLNSIDVYVDSNDSIVSQVDEDAVWLAYAASDDTFYLYSENGFLSVVELGPGRMGLSVSSKPTTEWTISGDYLKSDNGYYVNVSTNIYRVSTFTVSTASSESSLKAYIYNDDTTDYEIDFINLTITSPVAGEEPDVATSPESAIYYVDSTEWVPTSALFGYGIEYSAKITLKADNNDFSLNPTVVVNGVVAKTYTFDKATGILTLTFDRTLNVDEFDSGYYGVFIEVDDIDEDGTYVFIADNIAMTSDTIAMYENEPMLLGLDDETGDWYVDGNLLFAASESMVWTVENGALISQDGNYVQVYGGGPDALAGIYLEASSDTMWEFGVLGDEVLSVVGGGNNAKQLILNNDNTFTASEVRDGNPTPANVTIYRLSNLVPVEVYLDNIRDYNLSETDLDYNDIYLSYKGKLYQAGLFGSSDDIYIELPYDSNFTDYSYEIGISSKYVYYYDEDYDIIGFDEYNKDVIGAGRLNASQEASAEISFYTLSIYDGSKNPFDVQLVLNGYIGKRPLLRSKKGYTAEYYYKGTNRIFSFSTPVTRPLDIEIRWTEKDDTTDKVLSPTSKSSSKSLLDYAQSDSSYVSPAQIFSNFTDIQNHWARNQIEFVVLRGLFNGVSEYQFGPDLPMTRGMLATVLYRNHGKPYVAGGSGFGDVGNGLYYSDPVAWASANGIVEGYGNGQYGPIDNITREQIVTIIYRYAAFCKLDITAHASLDGFTDTDSVSDWATEAMQWCVASGIIEGKPGGIIDPKGNATRGELAVILQRFITLAGF